MAQILPWFATRPRTRSRELWVHGAEAVLGSGHHRDQAGFSQARTGEAPDSCHAGWERPQPSGAQGDPARHHPWEAVSAGPDPQTPLCPPPPLGQVWPWWSARWLWHLDAAPGYQDGRQTGLIALSHVVSHSEKEVVSFAASKTHGRTGVDLPRRLGGSLWWVALRLESSRRERRPWPALCGSAQPVARCHQAARAG